jgi:branched-chain amino acid transport system permease protein
MGFTALGGLAAVLVSYSPVGEAWRVGGFGMLISLFLLSSLVLCVFFINKLVNKKPHKYWLIAFVIIVGIIIINLFYKPAVQAIEAVNPATMACTAGL